MVALSPAVAAAQAPASAPTKFSIPAQDLSISLNQFARQSDHLIVFATDVAAGKRAPAIEGDLSAEQALAMLLAGAGLDFRREGDAFLIVQPGEGGSSPQQTGAGHAVDALIVTAQKREENIQDVPIAISAFTQEDLEQQKIEGGFDLLKGVPNVTFSKSNYSGYNFSIRGVGTKAVSATSDPGVAVAFNNVSLIRNRLFEQEYFDVERVEVLRGPQGTLYGRNATSGAINVVTARPDLYAFEGSVKVEVGNYESRRLSAFVNVPLVEDVLALRLAGASTERDGYSVNLANGDNTDGRDLWSGRVSLAFTPFDRLRADLVWERFEEDDDRLRTGKQLCHRDPGPTSVPGYAGVLDPIMRGRLSQGCLPGSLYDADAFGAPNGLSIPFVLAGQLLTPLGTKEPNLSLFQPRVFMLEPGVDPYGVEQSHDLRAFESQFNPEYRAKADIFALTVDFDLTPSLTVTSQTAYNEDMVWSFQDYNRFATQPTFNDSSGLYDFRNHIPATPTAPSPFADMMPGGWFTDPQIGRSNRIAGFEISSSESEQFSQELRLTSNFAGPLNFSLGANYTEFEGLNDYYLFFNIVTMIAQGFYNLSADPAGCNSLVIGGCMYIDPNPVQSVDGAGHNYFRNKNPYKLESKAVFGELYWEATDTLKVTAGLRYTDDRKSFTPWRSQMLVTSFDYGPDDPVNQRWTEYSGRLGVDWRPELTFTDETMVYAFYSRGYKGGGANPPPAQAEDQRFQAVNPRTFDPEFVDAFEIGAKNTLMGGALVLNTAAFFYDYQDYQVSKVVDRTIVNENFDARIWGAELEAVWRPTRDLRINASLGYLDTEIADGERSIDIFDRTQGNPGWMALTPWIQQTSNCILPTEVVVDALDAGLLPPPLTWASSIVIACQMYGTGAVGQHPTFDPDDYPEINNGAGFFADLSGNELPNAPHWTFNIGAQYTWAVLEGWEATLRGDYYRQSDSYARVYNTIADELRGWDNANLSLRLERPGDGLTFELYAKNLFDDTPITDAFLNSDSTGMTTNVFVLDPRLIGLSVRKAF